MASLNLAEAEQILAAAKAKVQSMGAKMSISVVDPRGFDGHGRRTYDTRARSCAGVPQR